MYGFRIIGPILIGASRLPPKIFLPLNIAGALIWAILFTSLGYVGGEVVSPWLHNFDQYVKRWIWLVIVIALVWLARYWFKRRERKDED